MSFDQFGDMDNEPWKYSCCLSISLFKGNAWNEVPLYFSVVLSGNLAVRTHQCMVRYCRNRVGQYDLSVRLRACTEYAAVPWKRNKKELFYSLDIWDS